MDLGWRFEPAKDRSHHERFSQFGVFTRGHSRYAYNTLRGVASIDGRSWPALMGDYHYSETSGTGKDRRTRSYNLSFLILETPFLGVPTLTIREEGIFDKLAGFVGFDDIDFESAQFSSRFHVKSSDKKFAYDVVHPRMMEFLLSGKPPSVELQRGCCLFYDGNRCWEPEKFRSTVAWAKAFFDRWPDHLTARLDLSERA
jgi:hypothetical protein